MSEDERIDAVRRAARDSLIRIAERLTPANDGATRAGQWGSSRHRLQVGEAVAAGFRDAARAAAARAEDLGYADERRAVVVEGVLLELIPTTLSRGLVLDQADQSALEVTLRTIVLETAADIRLGLRQTRAPDVIHQPLSIPQAVHINMHGGTGQFAIGSPHSMQSIDNRVDNSSVAPIDIERLLAAMLDLKTALASAQIPAAERDEIDDRLALIDAEAAKAKPDESRIRRALSYIGDKGANLGVAVGGQLLTGWLRSKGLIP